MKTRGLILSSAIGAVLCLSPMAALGKAAGCPCSPCKCSPCNCGGGGGKESGKHHGKEHRHDHGSSFGVGGTVDLGVIGHRTGEPNPFAASGEDKPVAHTEEKRTTKRKEKEPTTSNFDEIKLTGKDAKDESNPPNTFNVDNDQPQPPSAGSDAIGGLKKGHDDYHNALNDWLKKQPDWNNLVHDWTQSPNTEEGNKKSARAKKKIDKLFAQFAAGDGKQLVDDWKKAFDNALKSGVSVDDNSLVPPPRDEIEKKKYAVIKAQNDLKFEQKMYDDKKQMAANRDEDVKKAQKALSDLGATTTSDPKYKAAVADIDKAVNEAGQKWAKTDEGKAEMNKVHDAEKEVDKAKDAWKPFEKYVEK